MAALNPQDARRLLDELRGQELVLVSITRAAPAGLSGRAGRKRRLCFCEAIFE